MIKDVAQGDIFFSLRKFAEGESYAVSYADSNHILFITKGMASASVLSDTDKSHAGFASGDIVFFPVSFDFNITFASPGEMMDISFDTTVDVFRELQKILTTKENSSLMEFNGRLRMKFPLNMYVMLIQSYLKDGVMDPELSAAKLTELFIIFRTYYNEQEVRLLFEPLACSLPEFKTMVYAKMNLKYNIDELARACNMSKRTFERRFSEVFGGIPPYEWLQKQKAKKMLRMASCAGTTISDIIQEFDFYDPSHLYKFTKKQFGLSPEALLVKKK